MEDIFVYAAKRVANKGVLARIGHSAKLHSVRSAVSSKGSFGSKLGSLVGVAFRATMGAIPIPAVGSLIGAVETAVEKAIKSGLHSRRLSQAKASGDVGERVKFELKDLSVSDLDRYRWKVVEAMTAFNQAVSALEVNYSKKRLEGASCDAFLEVALAAEQATRRINKLKESCTAICAAMLMSIDWALECENGVQPSAAAQQPAVAGGASTGGVNGQKNKFSKYLTSFIEFEKNNLMLLDDQGKELHLAKYHGKCEQWCCFRAAGEVDNWQNAKNNAAWLLNKLADPFAPDSFSNNLGSLWK